MKRQFKTYFDYECARLKKQLAIFKKKHQGMSQNYYPDKMSSLFEKYIEVYGHAYCMDVKSERRKLVKMFYALLCELKN